MPRKCKYPPTITAGIKIAMDNDEEKKVLAINDGVQQKNKMQCMKHPLKIPQGCISHQEDDSVTVHSLQAENMSTNEDSKVAFIEGIVF